MNQESPGFSECGTVGVSIQTARSRGYPVVLDTLRLVVFLDTIIRITNV